MNDLFGKLMIQANITWLNPTNYATALAAEGQRKAIEQFAELIVQECIWIINKEHDEGIDRHGDYQLALYNAYREIKEHFGVE